MGQSRRTLVRLCVSVEGNKKVLCIMKDNANSELLALTADIVSAHVSNNSVAVADVPRMIAEVYQTLASVGEEPEEEAEELVPAVAIRSSIKPDYIVCLEDGKKLKMLKRHLKTSYDMSPEEYRQRWGLPSDYPMVAPNYAAQRSKLAKDIGLGTRRKGK